MNREVVLCEHGGVARMLKLDGLSCWSLVFSCFCGHCHCDSVADNV